VLEEQENIYTAIYIYILPSLFLSKYKDADCVKKHN